MIPVTTRAETICQTGVTEAALGWAAHQVLENSPPGGVVVLVDTLAGRAAEWAGALAFFAGEGGHPVTPLLFPALADPETGAGRAMEAGWDRTALLSALRQRHCTETLVLATSVQALLDPLPDRQALERGGLLLAAGKPFPFQQLRQKLADAMGYACEAVCENPGEFAVRGNLIDLYPVGATEPCRIDFFGDEIESIRTFDPTSQRSEGSVATLRVDPAQSAGTAMDGSLADYLDGPVTWIFREPDRLRETVPGAFERPERSDGLRDPSLHTLLNRPTASGDRLVSLSEVDPAVPLFQAPAIRENCEAGAVDVSGVRTEAAFPAGADGARRSEEDLVCQRLAGLAQHGHPLVCVLPGPQESDYWRGKLTAAGVPPRSLRISLGSLRQGFVIGVSGNTPPGPAYVTLRELRGASPRMESPLRRRRRAEVTQIDLGLDFAAMVEGDYLVHLGHGVCRFRGVTEVPSAQATVEVIVLEFADDIQLHLPVAESHLLSRYVGLRGSRPRLGKPGSGLWEKTRRQAEVATLDFAAKLLQTQARRTSSPGYAFPPDGEWQGTLEAAFPYRETSGQITAIHAIKEDMEAPRPMDRLLCGDVGFGKTEVALRAVFKAAAAGKQTAVLVPTTVLCQQHFDLFRERMAPYPIRVEMLSRFRRPGERQRVLAGLAKGTVEVVVGTHALLSPAVTFRDLGLLVIDEEHRFGVKHKETIRHLRQEVDVLSMSATPIPRTLYLALAGARDLSVIETPPRERLPVMTFVRRYDEALLRSAIAAELERGGQVFYLHNRIETIDGVAETLRSLFPAASVAVGHGQMTGHTLEKVMSAFVARRHDILVCTTIIESGIDIPNCNTLIIEGADRFGLSQLYQIRGRVGRFNRQAYCYLLLHRHAPLIDSARRRLSAIRQYTRLGAGYRIALRDLELRGAGNLLGVEQSGHVASVGFDLYCQLLKHSVSRLKGEVVASRVRANVSLDFIETGFRASSGGSADRGGYTALRSHAPTATAPVRAEIPAAYLAEDSLRLDLYRQLGLTATEEELADIEAATRDRFGPPPAPLRRLFEVVRIRLLAEQSGILSVETEGEVVRLRLPGNSPAFYQVGRRFPRLTAKPPEAKLKEIQTMLRRL